MFKKFLLVAIRHIRKNKKYSEISITGLALAVGCFTLPFVVKNFNESIDMFHKKGEQIYYVESRIGKSGGERLWGITPAPLGPALKNDFPQVEDYVRVNRGTAVVRSGDKIFKDRMYFTDSNPLGAQETNFSGTWVLNQEKTKLGEMPEIIIEISQDKEIINYLRTVRESGNKWVTQMSFSTDGKEGSYMDSRGYQLKCSCTFSDGNLVVHYQSRQRRSGKWVILEIEEEHSLSSDGKTLSIAHSEKWDEKGGKWPRPMVFGKLTPDAEAVQNKKNLFLGQHPPGKIPEVFAPGIVSIKNGKEYKPAISPDGKEIFFIRRTPGQRNDRLWYSRVEKGKLSTSQLAPFAYDCLEGQPCFTPDGKRLFFMSRRPLPGTTETSSEFRLWMVKKVKEGWGIPQYLPSVIDDHRPAQMSITKEGTIYFVSNKERKIFYSQLEGGSYKSAVKLDNKINDLPLVGHPAIAPDGSYIIVDLVYRKEGQLISDFLISFKNPDGSWRNPQSMKKALQITTQVYAAPYLSPDGKYLFFEEYIPQADQSDILWVSTRIIDALKPDDLE